MIVRPRSLLIVLAASVALGACNSGRGVSGSAACASSIKYAGQDYFGHSAKVTPSALGAELGKARIPACNDTGGSSERDEEVVAVEIKGVSPSVAVAVTYSDSVIFTRKDQPFRSLPENVLRLLRAVSVASPVVSPEAGFGGVVQVTFSTDDPAAQDAAAKVCGLTRGTRAGLANAPLPPAVRWYPKPSDSAAAVACLEDQESVLRVSLPLWQAGAATASGHTST